MRNPQKTIQTYLEAWRTCGYPDDIDDEVPDALMQRGLAPSWKAVAFCILRNDVTFRGLGFTGEESAWYSALKKIEISQRPARAGDVQGDMFFEIGRMPTAHNFA